MEARSRSLSSDRRNVRLSRVLPPTELDTRAELPCPCAPLLGRLGRRLAAATDLESLADAAIEELSTLRGLSGVELEVATSEGDWRVIRMVGSQKGAVVRRELAYEGVAVARVSVWAPVVEVTEVVELLDVYSGWLGLAFGSWLGPQSAAPTVNIVASYQATEALKLLSDNALRRPRCRAVPARVFSTADH